MTEGGDAHDWVSFYDSQHSIYVNARHRDVHYRTIAQDILPYVPSRDAAVLDYGSGEALHAGLIADACGSLVLAEAAPSVRAALTARFAKNPKVAVATPEEIAALDDECFDLIVMHSVAQYVSAEALDGLLALFRRLIKPGGTLVVGDVVPPGPAPVFASLALLRFGAAHGFLGAAFVGLLRTLASDYLRLRKALGLSQYAPEAMIDRLAAAGFTAKRAPRNIGHNQRRMTFVAFPTAGIPRNGG
ncbi:MAG TPA: methyltransferase domain-containing protein [Pseudolabrys sp.]|nr:methyltransferase domain-containing protein [Pseudolabrys sp.]